MPYTVITTVAAAAVIYGGAAAAAHAQEGDLIPAWVKSVFSFYVNGEITEAELINALEYLIDQNIIQVAPAAPAPPPPPAAEPSNEPATGNVFTAMHHASNGRVAIDMANDKIYDALNSLERASDNMVNYNFARAADHMNTMAAHLARAADHMNSAAKAFTDTATHASNANITSQYTELATITASAADIITAATPKITAAADDMAAATDKTSAASAYMAATNALIPLADIMTSITDQ